MKGNVTAGYIKQQLQMFFEIEYVKRNNHGFPYILQQIDIYQEHRILPSISLN